MCVCVHVFMFWLIPGLHISPAARVSYSSLWQPRDPSTLIPADDSPLLRLRMTDPIPSRVNLTNDWRLEFRTSLGVIAALCEFNKPKQITFIIIIIQVWFKIQKALLSKIVAMLENVLWISRTFQQNACHFAQATFDINVIFLLCLSF